MTISTPVLFGPDDRSLFGWVHQPEGRLSRGTAVLCPPLTREYLNAHGTYRVLADALAERGITAIRFDYDGTGDSAGGDGDPGRMDAYLASIRHAIDLAHHLGTTDLALVGMRMGALLAARAAVACPRVATLVLWDPCASGREFLREQSALFRLRFGKTHPKDGGTEVPGFVLSAQTADDLRSMAAPSSLPHVERALVLTRPDRNAAGTFGVALDRVESTEAVGQADLMDVEPLVGKVPQSTETIADWLGDALPTERSAQAASDSRDEMTLTNGAGVVVTERLVKLGPHHLFGIETTCQVEPGVPPILFLNSGCDPHTGPNRLWVDLARDWACLGFRCIRFDLSGLGDSPVRPGQAVDVVRPPEAFDDVVDAVGNVVDNDQGNGVVPVVLAGLCSGGYQALESAIDLRPSGVLAINPQIRFEPPETKNGMLDPRRRLCRPAGALTRTYRSLPSTKVMRLARQVYLFATRLRRRNRSAIYWLDEMSARGTDVLCICGEEDAAAFFDGEVSAGDRLASNDSVRIDVIPDLDHGLIVASQRADVIERLTTHVVTRYLGNSEPVRATASE